MLSTILEYYPLLCDTEETTNVSSYFIYTQNIYIFQIKYKKKQCLYKNTLYIDCVS